MRWVKKPTLFFASYVKYDPTRVFVMEKETWKSISIRDKMQIINGTVLIISAIALYFISFALTLTIGMGVVSACSTMLATGLAFFGITSYIKNQMVNFEAKVNNKMKELEENDYKRREHRDKENGDIPHDN